MFMYLPSWGTNISIIVREQLKNMEMETFKVHFITRLSTSIKMTKKLIRDNTKTDRNLQFTPTYLTIFQAV